MSLGEHLATLEASGLIRLLEIRPELQYLFRHSLVQEAAYDSLVKTDRRALHLAAGRAFEKLYPGRVETRELAHLLAHHFYAAGEAAKALHYFTVAGDAAADVYANAEAIRYFQQALEFASGTASDFPAEAQPLSSESLLHLFSRSGRALELIGRFEEAEQTYRDLEEVARKRADEHLELEGLMRRTTLRAVPTAQMELEEGLALSERTIGLARRLGDPAAEARSLWNLSNVYRFAAQPELSVKYGEEAVAVARAHGLRDLLSLALNDVSTNYWSLARPAEGLAALEEARQLLTELGNLPHLTDCLTNMSQMYFYGGDLDRAEDLGREAQRISISIANPWGQAFSLATLADVHIERGEMGRGMAAYVEGIQMSHEAGFLIGQIWIRSILARCYGRLGDVERGFEIARVALARAKEAGPLFEAGPLGIMAELYLFQGDADLAAKTMAETRALIGDNFRRR